MNKFLPIKLLFIFTLISTLLSGCAVVAVGGAAAASYAVWHDRRTTGTLLDDSSIEFKINQAIKADKNLAPSAHITPVSYNNVVLLVGQVPSRELNDRLDTIVRNVPKVRSIYNEVTISGPTSLVTRSSDSWITTKVKKEMLMAKDLDPTRIKVITEDGIVYLLGIVKAPEEKSSVEIARSVEGVKKVVKIFEHIQ